MEQSRPFKIDLQISKRRKKTLLTLCNQQYRSQNIQVLKKTKPKKMINLTMVSRYNPNEQKPDSNPQQVKHKCTNVSISEFTVEALHKQQTITQFQQLHSPILSSVREVQTAEENKEWWQYVKTQKEQCKEELMIEAIKQENKIKFFLDLLEQKKRKFKAQKNQKIKKYESYISNLLKLYQQQLKQEREIKGKMKQIGHSYNEEMYRQIRKEINKDGKHGLNYSPKQISVFSGTSDTILLSKGTSYEGSVKKIQNFSFGSSKKQDKKSVSSSKERLPFLLNTKINLIYRRKLNYDQI